ncbi:MAG: hypothetical protein J3Q66DRAFT_350067 [Benniella sp.]|nr:MAG: hypothetical protein J3Q66DRAFT_350067 [Benniella sp.]
MASMESDQNIKLCHVDSAGLRFNCRHFINGHNVTSLVSKGQAAMILTDPSANTMSPWSSHGISRIVPIRTRMSEDCWRGWIRFKDNGLRPSDTHLHYNILRRITLDVHWSTCDPERLTNCLALTEASRAHSPEAMALLMSLENVLSNLAGEYPLIFSPEDATRYRQMTRLGALSATSLCRIHDRATHISVNQSISASLERMQKQYSSTPQDRLYLLECAFQETSYRVIKEKPSNRLACQKGGSGTMTWEPQPVKTTRSLLGNDGEEHHGQRVARVTPNDSMDQEECRNEHDLAFADLSSSDESAFSDFVFSSDEDNDGYDL